MDELVAVLNALDAYDARVAALKADGTMPDGKAGKFLRAAIFLEEYARVEPDSDNATKYAEYAGWLHLLARLLSR